MNKQDFIQLLEFPEKVTATEVTALRSIIDTFPYLQSAHAVYLKGLHNQGSFAYNNALKVTAAHTTDRAVLFEYITSEVFTQNDISTQIKQQEQQLRALVIKDAQDVSVILQEEELQKADQILDPGLFVEKQDSTLTPKSPEETLSVGTPLSFDTNEAHSFSEWLKLAAFKPITREKRTTQEVVPEESKTTVAKATTETVLGVDEVRKRKQEIIDSFIETSPKIQVSPTAFSEKKNLAKQNLIPQEVLMTETLARVYVEQKNYKKAKQAYRILSLKYPEKSGFFADQIRAVEQLEANTKK